MQDAVFTLVYKQCQRDRPFFFKKKRPLHYFIANIFCFASEENKEFKVRLFHVTGDFFVVCKVSDCLEYRNIMLSLQL